MLVREKNKPLRKWITERRNIIADFERAFGTKPENPVEAFSLFTDNAQMTPTLKIRRHKIKAVYGERLEALYG